tara:strand:- start:23 stop:358 length:336 start_codon:yes stop_codon:yes gene_type:complete
MPKLDPQCIKGKISFAVTNREQLIPCCYLDDEDINHPLLQKLLKVSKIDSTNTIDKILNHKEWKRFYKNLTKNIAPPSCHLICAKAKDIKEKQSWQLVDPESGKVVFKNEF